MIIGELIRRRANLKKKFQQRKKIFGAWTSLAHPSITEIFAKTGVDFIGIDLEHSTISLEQAQQIIALCQANGVLCLPRIASHNKEMARRLLDSGADGLIVPTVSRPEDVETIVSWSKYPPQGKRGFGVARAQGYGFDFDRYIKTWNASSIIIPQIESIEAVENIEKILGYPEVDGVMVGPYDLSGSLNIPGQLEHKSVQEACRKVIACCKTMKKSCGTQLIEPDRASLKKAFARGYSFVILSSDVFLLWKWAQCIQQLIRQERG